jgi:hypothetical protein
MSTPLMLHYVMSTPGYPCAGASGASHARRELQQA